MLTLHKPDMYVLTTCERTLLLPKLRSVRNRRRIGRLAPSVHAVAEIFLKDAAIRDRKGMTQRALAAKANMSYTYLCNVENGKDDRSLSTLRRIAKALNVRLVLTCWMNRKEAAYRDAVSAEEKRSDR
jgi:DNA-binding XRE family transcriptional regulator